MQVVDLGSVIGPKGDKGDKGENGLSLYAECSTAAATAAKTATCSAEFTLAAGISVAIKFTNANTASSPTLNVNSTGAKAIKIFGTTAIPANFWQAGTIVYFVYDGTNWLLQNGTQATTTYYGLTKLSGSTSSTSSSIAATSGAVKTAYDLADSKSKINPPVTVTFTASGWTQDETSGNYTQSIACTGLLSTDDYRTRVEPVGNADDSDTQALTDEAFSLIDYMACNTDGYLFARCPNSAPSVNLSVAVIIAR
jgi:hypothetical protein